MSQLRLGYLCDRLIDYGPIVDECLAVHLTTCYYLSVTVCMQYVPDVGAGSDDTSTTPLLLWTLLRGLVSPLPCSMLCAT